MSVPIALWISRPTSAHEAQCDEVTKTASHRHVAASAVAGALACPYSIGTRVVVCLSLAWRVSERLVALSCIASLAREL
jgi:hypothetical protein